MAFGSHVNDDDVDDDDKDEDNDDANIFWTTRKFEKKSGIKDIFW